MKEHEFKSEAEAVQDLFDMEPDNRLTPAQMMKRSLFPRWEIIRPSSYDPVRAEDARIKELVEQAEFDSEQPPGH